jgi:hypothetical protein
MPTETGPVRNLIGANMSFRREVLALVGGFQDGIGRIGTRPVGCEETDLCIRVHRALPHAMLLYEPQARVLHRVPEQRTRWSYFRSRCFAEGISKALVARRVGAGSALETERAYASRQLPRAVAAGLRAAAGGDLFGLQRAAAVVGGLAVTAAGFAVGTAVAGKGADSAAPTLRPRGLRPRGRLNRPVDTTEVTSNPSQGTGAGAA